MFYRKRFTPTVKRKGVPDEEYVGQIQHPRHQFLKGLAALLRLSEFLERSRRLTPWKLTSQLYQRQEEIE